MKLPRSTPTIVGLAALASLTFTAVAGASPLPATATSTTASTSGTTSTTTVQSSTTSTAPTETSTTGPATTSRTDSPGAQGVVVIGENQNGGTAVGIFPLGELSTAPSLPRTGSSPLPATLVGLALLTAGILATTAKKRRPLS